MHLSTYVATATGLLACISALNHELEMVSGSCIVMQCHRLAPNNDCIARPVPVEPSYVYRSSQQVDTSLSLLPTSESPPPPPQQLPPLQCVASVLLPTCAVFNTERDVFRLAVGTQCPDSTFIRRRQTVTVDERGQAFSVNERTGERWTTCRVGQEMRRAWTTVRRLGPPTVTGLGDPCQQAPWQHTTFSTSQPALLNGWPHYESVTSGGTMHVYWTPGARPGRSDDIDTPAGIGSVMQAVFVEHSPAQARSGL